MKINIRSVDDFKKTLLIKGFSQRQLSKQTGISNPYINQIANGSKNPGPVIANRIAEALDVDFDDIFFVNDDNKSNQSKEVI